MDDRPSDVDNTEDQAPHQDTLATENGSPWIRPRRRRASAVRRRGPGPEIRVPWEPWLLPTRVAIAIGTIIALALILNSGIDAGAAERATREPSAVRLAAIYAEYTFYAIVATGLGVARYIFTRARV